MSKKEELVTQNNLPAGVDTDFLKSFGGGALDNLSTTDLVIPRYKLIQNTSKEGTPGKFVSNLSDIEHDVLDIIILDITNFRTMFPEPYNSGDKPLCRSNNGRVMTDPNGAGSGNCDSCQYAVWGKDKNGNTLRPPCSAGYSILCLVNTGAGLEPAIIGVKGAGIKPAKGYFTRMKTRGIAPFTYITKVVSESVSNAKGRFFVMGFDFGEVLDKATIEFAAEQYKIMQSMNRDVMIDLGREEEEAPAPQASASFNDALKSVTSEKDNGASEML